MFFVKKLGTGIGIIRERAHRSQRKIINVEIGMGEAQFYFNPDFFPGAPGRLPNFM